MSKWFQDRRQEFIAATLRQFGQIRRADLIREFDISTPQASNDIATFMAADPPHVRYDVSAKAYVFESEADHVPPKIPTHAYSPDPEYPWFCGVCGYPEHERLKHPPSKSPPATEKNDAANC